MKCIVMTEKGGAGKSFISANVIAPAMYILLKRKIKLVEIDTSNFTSNYLSDSQVIEAISIDLTDDRKDDKKIENVLLKILEDDKEIYDVGSNSVLDILSVLAHGYVHMFDFVFIPFSHANVNEIELANRMINNLVKIGYDKQNIYVIANKYDETKESLLKHIETDKEHIIRINYIDIHDEAMKNMMTLYDIYMNIDIEKNREAIREAGKKKDLDTIRKLVYMNTLKAKTIEFYDLNKDFKKLVDVLGGAI